jgi:hypothetical protein
VAEDTVLSSVRTYLLATLIIGIVGMEVELLLLGHFEGLAQIAPVALLGAGLLVAGWHGAAPTARTVRVLQATMGAFVLSGAMGVGLHYSGNVEFEREMYPSMAGPELVGRTLTGATPVLAPGTMTLLGLMGLMHAYRHPRTQWNQEMTT